jgi:hypothetical protein
MSFNRVLLKAGFVGLKEERVVSQVSWETTVALFVFLLRVSGVVVGNASITIVLGIL